MSVPIEGRSAQAIADSVRDLVNAGRLSPGEALPPIRTLAGELGVNRNTVAAAYQLLVAAGAAHTRGRGGTAVSTIPTTVSEGIPEPDTVDLASGNPDPAFLPDLRNALVAAPYTAALYGSPAITEPLLAAAQSLFTDAPRSQIAVTHGAVDAIERILATHLTRGDAVAVEDPCFLASIDTVRLNGYRPLAVPLDEYGMTVEGLERALHRGARAVIITTRAHNPTGASVSVARAHDLAQLLTAHPHVLVIEDDHLSALSAHPYSRIAPDTSHRWALVRSVAKFLGPDLRLALTLADDVTTAAINTRLRAGKNWVSHLLQSTTAHLLTDPTTGELVKTAGATYRHRMSTLVAALAEHDIAVFGDPDGLNVWLDLPNPSTVHTTHHHLRTTGWAIRTHEAFAVDPATPRSGLRITTAALPPHHAPALADTLRSAIR